MQVFWRVVVLVLVAATASVAQVERASIVGSVTDNTGAVLPGVQVKVTNEATNTSVTGQTDSAGAYSVVNLTPGTYTIEAEKGGFSRRVQRGLLLQVAQTARLDLQLSVGAVEQSIEVRADAQLLQTEGSSVGQVIGTQPIATLPLNGRNFAQLAILAPGVTGLSYAQTGTINSGVRPDELCAGWPPRRQFRSDCGKEIPIHGTETADFPRGILQRIQSPAVPDPECYDNRLGRRGFNQCHCSALATDSICVENALLKTVRSAKGSAPQCSGGGCLLRLGGFRPESRAGQEL